MSGVAFRQKIILYPPRPDTSITSDTLEKYPGWVAQRKWNGTRNLIYILPDGSYELYNRHKSPHKAYKITRSMDASIRELISRCKPGVFYVFDSELMDAKTKKLKDKIVLYDALVFDGEYLLGATYEHRYGLLKTLLGNPTAHEEDTGHRLALKFNQNLWLSEVFTITKDFKKLFDQALDKDEIEGLVLKDPRGKLDFGTRETNNGGWLIRVRKPHKNYQF